MSQKGRNGGVDIRMDRFLHDVIINVMNETGYGEGLFEEEEKVSSNVKDKGAKIQFLEKIIACVGFSQVIVTKYMA